MAHVFFEIENEDKLGMRSLSQRQGAGVFLMSKRYAWDYFEIDESSANKSVRFRLPFDADGRDRLGSLLRPAANFQWGKEPVRNLSSRVRAKAGPPLESFEAIRGVAVYEELWLTNRPILRIAEAADFALADIESAALMAAAFWMGVPIVVAPCVRRKAGEHWEKLGANAKQLAAGAFSGRENELGYMVQVLIGDTIELIAPVRLDPRRQFRPNGAGDYRSPGKEGFSVLVGREAMSHMVVGVRARGGITFGR